MEIKNAATLGRLVHYRLSSSDCWQISQTRAQHGIHGNDCHLGDVFPALVVRAWTGTGTVNLQVFLDGEDVLWVTVKTEGTIPGTWAWPTLSKD